ncbi:hypothetical protein ACIP5Y_21695 [Nocardia sp. NPDC088792]|uniref:DUF7336 domain-containing protein n=1 Tax=Nocardia sp. NPDC088792 TaxID=3364332 RepID=UPI003810F050
MEEVYLLQHYYELADGTEKLRTIGAYSSEANAQRAMDRLVELPGFRDRPKDFHILKHPLDKDYWTEGYFTA